ncbi:MAG: hypothetical protein AB8B96_16950 [Lysobacterales bacterium]
MPVSALLPVVEKLHIDPGPMEYSLVLFVAGVLGGATWMAYRQWGLCQTLIVLLVLDLYVGGVELPSRLSERAVVVGQEWLILRAGRWYDPINIYLPLDEVMIIYEVERDRGWLANETFWLFQDSRFRRKSLPLPPLFKRQRHDAVEFLATQDIAFQVQQSVEPGKPSAPKKRSPAQ